MGNGESTKSALAVRHVGFEHVGSLAGVLASAGYALGYAEAGVHALSATGDTPDLLIMLGGPIGAYEEALYPYLRDELALIERQLEAGKPLLGICLGAQLIARALGADVYPGPAKEIGWAPIVPTADGAGSVLAPLTENDWHVLHWHGDTFDLPAGATRLASTEIAENQAFSLGHNVLALQFHIEAVASEIELWLIGHAAEIAAAPGVEVAAIRAGTARWGIGLETAGRKVFTSWLQTVAAAA